VYKVPKKILDGNIESTLKAKLKKIAVENEFEILEIECDKDHVHLLVDCSPQHFIPNIIKAMKGVSARHMFKEHPEIKNKIWVAVYGIHPTT
jgi:putative transposase